MLAYIDCFSGIAGDMFLASLIDLGLEPPFLAEQLSLLHLEGYLLQISRSTRHGLSGVRFDVEVSASQPHRKYSDIRRLIEDSGLDEGIKSRALTVFEVIASAEAHVHGVDKETVHFHEVGAVDSIIDVVGAVIGVTALGITKLISSPLPMSRGFVRTAHGRIPVPAPATLKILEGLPVKGVDSDIELVTPTGAAIVKALVQEFGPYPAFIPVSTGYGLGRSNPAEFPNALRVTLGNQTHEGLGRDQVGVLECQVDDLDPRILGDLMDLLYSKGALEVTFAPVHMKKNRPGTVITVITRQEAMKETALLLVDHTTTLGVRTRYSDRLVLERRVEIVETSMGPLRVKLVDRTDGGTDRRPEFDDVRRIARETDRPVQEILRRLERELEG